MRIIWVIFFGLSFITFSNAQDSLQTSITTHGTVELNVPADFASVSFTIKSNGSTLRQAVKNAKTRVQTITNDLLKMGLNKSNISTSKFFSGENIGGQSFFTSKNDFKTEIITYIKIDSLEILEDVVLLISDHQPDEISNISFKLKNPEDYKMKAVKEAIKKARQKAIILATEMGVSIGKPIKIEEEIFSLQPYYGLHGGRTNLSNSVYFFDTPEKGSQSIYSESVKIEAKVRLVTSIK